MFHPLPVLTALTLAALAILIALGVWQLERREEKHALIARIEERSKTPPAPIEILLAAGDDFAAHRRATATGQLVASQRVFVFSPRTDKGPTEQGYKLVYALTLSSGGTLLVDQGWVSAKGLEAPEVSAIADNLEVDGVLRPSSASGPFTPAPDAAKSVVFVRDSGTIAAMLGVTLKTKLILEATPSNDEHALEQLPYGVNIPDNHLNYALTWFSLGLVLLVIYFRYHFVRGRLKFSR